MSDHPLADGTDAGALAVILDECKGGPWKPDDGTSLWFYNAAGDQIHLTGDDVALLLHAALAGAAPRAEGLPSVELDPNRLTKAFAEAVGIGLSEQARDAIVFEYRRIDPRYQATLPTAADVRGRLSRPSDERVPESEER